MVAVCCAVMDTARAASGRFPQKMENIPSGMKKRGHACGAAP